MPSTPFSGSPFIVYVLPDPVCPYAKQVTLAPWKAHSTIGRTHSRYTSIWPNVHLGCCCGRRGRSRIWSCALPRILWGPPSTWLIGGVLLLADAHFRVAGHLDHVLLATTLFFLVQRPLADHHADFRLIALLLRIIHTLNIYLKLCRLCLWGSC